jgi:hypothetical protein
MNSIKRYSELIKLKTFKERFEYLRLNGNVCEDTFGYNRYLNQIFYKSPEWLRIRNYVITRDNGCDLGIPEREIRGTRILIHHMNPITEKDILNRSDYLLNPEYLITTIKVTHDAIHYGTEELLYSEPIVRRKNDTCLWK